MAHIYEPGQPPESEPVTVEADQGFVTLRLDTGLEVVFAESELLAAIGTDTERQAA